MINKLAAAAAAALIFSLTGCGASETTEITAEPDGKVIGASSTAGAPALTDGLFRGTGYTLSLPSDKWMSSESYISMLKSGGYTVDEADARVDEDSEGVYYFVDESVKKGMEKEYFTYDVPFVIFGKPVEEESYRQDDIETIGKQMIDSAVKLYDSIDGMSVDMKESGVVAIGGRRYVKTIVDNRLAGGEIALKRLNYSTIDDGKMYTFSFSSTDELSERMVPEYETVLDSLVIESE